MRELFRYGLLGAVTYAVSLALMFVLAEQLKFAELTAYAIVQVIVFSTNFFVARAWVFPSCGRPPIEQARRFVLSTVLFRASNWALYSLLWLTLGLPREQGILLAIVLIFPLKFVVDKALVFSRGDIVGVRSALRR